MSSIGKFVTAGLVLLLPCVAWADAAGDYQGLFGEEEKAAAAKGAKAAPEFAAKLLIAARAVSGQKDLQALLYEKACEFGMKAPAGQATAIEALKLLIDSAGDDKKAAAQDKLLALIQARYPKSTGDERKRLGEDLVGLLVDCGDGRADAKQPTEALALYRRALAVATGAQSARTKEITDRIKDLSAAQDAEKRIAELRARLSKNPADTTARTGLILACLGELDDPDEAAKLLTGDVDEGLRTYVPLAAKKVADLGEAACLDLAKWYGAMADKLPQPGKSILLGRAQQCCQRYLELHQAEDASRLTGKMLLAKVDKALEKAGGPPAKNRAMTLDLGGKVTMKLVRIPAGKFMMGTPDDEPGRNGNEGPQHLVEISRSFYMGVYEVTQAQYEAVMGKNPRFKAPDNPVDGMSGDDAAEFCKTLSKRTGKSIRLPSEAEWEYACRAGTTTAYSFGNDPGKAGDYAWFYANANGKTHPVGQKKPNPWGLYDMCGNVWEWCSDWYAGSYAKAKPVDPHGPDSGKEKVLRGGSYWKAPVEFRSAYRGASPPHGPWEDRGFRVVVGGE
jgi:formylglycine-generating enzyme required for sulfatase activity